MAKRDEPPRKQKEQPFNNPFAKLKLPEPPPKKAIPPTSAPKPRGPSDDALLFAQAMDGVQPIANRGEAAPAPELRARVVSDEAEALAQLADLVSGVGPFDISDSDEFVEGGQPDLDRRVLRALRTGDFAVQGNLDLHGLTRLEAHDAVEKFISDARRAGKRCVLLVHGRGLNSKDQIPVLKEQLQLWLKRGRIAKSVLAFATARPHDGGAGALYVLLRR